jgi:UPF0176 protein
MKAVIYFIQCEQCAQQMEGCCSKDCIDVIHLPEEERKATRKGIEIKYLKKGKSDVLTLEIATYYDP